jgi:hypothetical protein
MRGSRGISHGNSLSRSDISGTFESKILAFSLDTINIPFVEQLLKLDKNTLVQNVAARESDSSTSTNLSTEQLTHTLSHLSISSKKADFTYPRYYLPLILEECRAVLAQSLAVIDRNELPPSLMKLVNRDTRKNTLELKGNLSLDMLEGARTHIAILLRMPGHQNVLALGSIKSIVTNEVVINIKVDESCSIMKGTAGFLSYSERAQPSVEVWILGSLVSQARMYHACSSYNFAMNNVYAEQSIKYLSDLSAGKIEPFLTDAQTEPFKQDAEDTASVYHLNDSQSLALKHFLSLKQGIQLLQGPPGTGKTTTIAALAAALVKNKNRLMICAPSNKAVQVIAKRVLANLPDTPLALAGISKKLDPALRTIFIHTWQDDRLASVAWIERSEIQGSYSPKSQLLYAHPVPQSSSGSVQIACKWSGKTTIAFVLNGQAFFTWSRASLSIST